MRTLRFHGSEDKVDYVDIGYNSRLDELQAAILRVQLPHLDRWAAAARGGGRRGTPRRWTASSRLPVADAGRAPRLAPVRDPPRRGRRASRRALAAAGIGARAYYRTPCTRSRRWRRGRRASRCPGPTTRRRTHLAIPMSAALTPEQVAEVAAAVARRALRGA